MRRSDNGPHRLNGRIYSGGKLWSTESYANMRRKQTEYNRSKYYTTTVRFRRDSAAREIEWLMSQPSISKCVLKLVSDEMHREKAEALEK